MSGEQKPGRDWGPWAYGGAGVLTLVGVWALDVFTVHGLLTALWLAPSDGLWWPTGTRILWGIVFYALASGRIQRLMWREGVLRMDNHLQLWAASHIDACQRLGRRARWWAGGVHAAWRQWDAMRPLDTPITAPTAMSTTVQDAPAAAEPAAA